MCLVIYFESVKRQKVNFMYSVSFVTDWLNKYRFVYFLITDLVIYFESVRHQKFNFIIVLVVLPIDWIRTDLCIFLSPIWFFTLNLSNVNVMNYFTHRLYEYCYRQFNTDVNVLLYKQVVYTFIRSDVTTYETSINQHCQLRHIATIEKILNKYNKLNQFKTSCFRHFFNFSRDMMFSSKLVHAVLAKEIVVEGAGKWEMYFRIGKVKARFSKEEFCLCTGLRFG